MAGTTTTATLPSGSASTGKRSQRNVKTLPLIAPSVIVLFLWMIVPLAMTLWFSFQYYNLLDPSVGGFAGFENYTFLLTDPSLWTAMANTLYLVFWVLVAIIALHVAAILWYRIVRRDDLVTPMITGRGVPVEGEGPMVPAPLWRLLFSVVLAAGLTFVLARFL